MYLGWHQVAFTREIAEELRAVQVGELPLVLVRTRERLRAFDAACPHRGAHLAYGGCLDGEIIVCPFHGRRIGLGNDSPSGYHVREYPVLDVGGSVFVLLSERFEHGFTPYMHGLDETHYFVPGFTLPARVAPEYVIENVFDTDHFHAVHGISRRPHLEVRPGADGHLAVEAIFRTSRPNPWQQAPAGEDPVETRFLARVFSPTLCASELGSGDHRHVVVTAATPTADGGCVIRVTLAFPPPDGGGPPDADLVRSLMRDSKTAFEQDMVVWEHLVPGAPSRLEASDRPVIEYRAFCERFLPP